MNDFYIELLFLLGVSSTTLLIGYPLTTVMKIPRFSTRLLLSFTSGFAIITFSGLLANRFELPVFKFQIVSISIFLLILFRDIKNFKDFPLKFKEMHLIETLLLLFTFIATILLTHSFSKIIMWAPSDGAFHSYFVKMITDGMSIPMNIFIPGISNYEYFQYYPKGFHFYVAFFVKFFNFDIVKSIKIIPLIIQILIPVGIYVLLVEVKALREIAFFSFLFTFLQFNHIWPLFFGLFPSMTSLLIILSMLIFIIASESSRRFHYIFFLGFMILVYFIHPRYLLHGLLVGGWCLLWNFRNEGFAALGKYSLASFAILGITFLLFSGFKLPSFPVYMWEYTTKFFSHFIPRWYLTFLALPGFFLMSMRKNKEDLFVLGWFLIWFALAFLMDINVLGPFGNTLDRNYQELYLPISVLAGHALFAILISSKNKKNFTYLISISSIIVYTIMLGSLFMHYVPDWSLTPDDYTVIKSLEGNSGVVVTVDPSGRWVYPITGLLVTTPPNGITPLLNNSDTMTIIENPSSEASVSILKSLEEMYGDVYVFISQKSSDPLIYNLFGNIYPAVVVDEFNNSEVYEVFGEKNGSFLFRYKG